MKTKRELLIRMLSFLKPHKKKLLIVGCLLVVSSVVGFLQPLVIRDITDRGMMQKNFVVILSSVAILVILIVINQGRELLQIKIFTEIHNDVSFDIFSSAFQKLLHLKKNYFSDKNTAEILNFLQTDISQVASITDQYTVTCISYLFRIVSGLIGLFIINWKLAMVVLAMVPAKYLLVRHLSKRQEKAMDALIEKSREFSGWFGDNIEGIDEIKLWNLYKTMESAFSEKKRKILEMSKTNTMIGGWNSFWQMLLEWSVTIAIYLLGGYQICTGKMTIGTVFTFVSYSSYVTGPVGAFINLKMFFSHVFPSAKRLFQFMDLETEDNSGRKKITKVPPTLELQNVAFQYCTDRTILKNVNLLIHPGEKIAIIGKNGSGKSTIINLLLRFYEPNSGVIFANGIDVKQIPLENYRDLFSVVSQSPYLFLGDIIQNINLNNSYEMEKIQKILEISGVAGYISNMPEGYNTQVGKNGTRLSGGEKQKIAVARALLKNAPIVILDEATSNFDMESNSYLHDVILNEMKGKTVIMITHHYSNLKGMDRVFEIESGELNEKRED